MWQNSLESSGLGDTHCLSGKSHVRENILFVRGAVGKVLFPGQGSQYKKMKGTFREEVDNRE